MKFPFAMERCASLDPRQSPYRASIMPYDAQPSGAASPGMMQVHAAASSYGMNSRLPPTCYDRRIAVGLLSATIAPPRSMIVFRTVSTPS